MENDVWTSINEYFDTTYLIFPIVSYYDIASRLVLQPDWRSSQHLYTLLLALQLINAAARCIHNLIREVETSRLSHNFADPGTLDAVVCSICLFTAYNVLELHNRAFLYLEEALTLFDVTPPCEAEDERRRRIERVLFNTEAASIAIYAARGRHRRARRPSARRHNRNTAEESFCNDAGVEKIAACLLDGLTEIYLSEDADELTNVNLGVETDMQPSMGASASLIYRSPT